MLRLQAHCGKLPWLTAGVGILGLAVRFFLPTPASWAPMDAWPSYVAATIICFLLLGLAHLGWQCHVDRQKASLPAPPILAILIDLSKRSGFVGTPSDFNREAQRLLFGKQFADLMPQPSDYYSSLMSGGLIEITSLTDHGNKPDGTPDTSVNVCLSSKGEKIVQSLSV